jgi:hypothetical protein
MRSQDLADDPDYRTFKELDAEFGLPKGSAFKAFKALAGSLVEGSDFACCDRRAAPAQWQRLAGRVYPGTTNAVLLGARARLAIAAKLGERAHD